MWSYLVKGAPPEYVTPQVAAKIDNRMDPAVADRMAANAARSRNIMRENMVVRSSSKASTSVASVGSKGPGSVASSRK